MSGMAEVLADHHGKHFNPSRCAVICLDPTCNWESSAEHFAIAGELFADHQASTLTAAGFGLVSEAKSAALEEAANEFAKRAENTRNNVTILSGLDFYREMMQHADELEKVAYKLRARAVTVRGEV